MKTAAAYIRVSTDDQIEYSPESQRKALRDYAQKNDLILPASLIFCDEGISGKDAKHRPAFNQMLALAKSEEHPFDVILVWKFSRFARNQEESIVIKNLLRKSGVEVRSISEPVDPDSAFGSLIERIIEWMDEYYLINLSGEVKRGMLERASRGEAVSIAPFGYRMTDGKLVPDPEEAPLVQEIFRTYLAGDGLRAIAMRLNARGVRTHRGNQLDNRAIEYILHNPVYIGKLRWSKEGRAASTRRYDNPNIIIVDGVHPPIIEPEIFEAAQQRMAEIKKKFAPYQRREQTVDFALKGLVRCSACGGTLCHSSAKEPSLQCHNYARGSCKVSHHTAMTKIEAAVLDGLRTAAMTGQFTLAPDRPVDKSDKTNDLRKQLAAAQRRLRRVRDAYESGADTLEEYAQSKKKIQAEITRLESEIEKAAAAARAGQEQPDALAAKVRSVIEIFADPNQPPKIKNDALRTVVDHITFDRPASTITITFYA